MKKASNFTSSLMRDEASSKKDYSWRGGVQNPYKDNKKVYLKLKVQLIILALCLLIAAGVGIYHPFFHIDKINVTGLQRIPETEFKDAVLGMATYKKLFLFPAQSFFLTDVSELEGIIKERFPLELIIVKKTFPDVLDIQLEEKISTVIYDNGKQYSYLGLEGKVVEILRNVGDDEWQEKTETVTSTNELGEEIQEIKILERNHKPPIASLILEIGDYPIVYDARGISAEVNKKVMEENTVKGVIEWFNLINKQTDIPFGYIILEGPSAGSGQEGRIKTREGWEMKVVLNEGIEEQFEELQYLLKEKIIRPDLNYIDLRYEGRIYWQ